MPDIPANDSTPVTITVNDTYLGTVEENGDRDWIRVNVINGQNVQVNLDSYNDDNNGLGDPNLRIYDRNGVLVAFNDDDANGIVNTFNSETTFSATYTGAYYIEASGFRTRSGDYEIRTQDVVQLPAGPLTSLYWGVPADVPNDVVQVYFTPDGGTYDGYTSEGFNAYEKAQFVRAMDYIADRTGLDFNIVTDVNDAHAVLVLDLDELSNETDPILGYFNPPGTSNAGVGVFNGVGQGWDRTAGGGLEEGGYGYVTIMHELLHGLGMAHPHDTGGTSNIMNGVTSSFGDFGNNDLNQGVFTVMSYNSGYFTGATGSALVPDGSSYGFENGPMALDLALLQAIYGTGDGHNGTGTTYNLAGANVTGTYWETIWDTGGFDVISYGGIRAATIDLRMASLRDAEGGGGYVSSANGIAGGFTIANGVVIEAARGGFGSDTITGNGANNVLIGRGGNDTIAGGGGIDRIRGDNGRDVIYGGAGADTVLGHTGNDRLYGGDNNDFMQGGAGDDIMHGGFNNDYMQGGNNRDEMFGGNGADDLRGEQGNDFLSGDQGADHLTGGAGADMFIYHSASDSLNTTNRRDVITDFTRGQDKIDLSQLDAGRGIAGDQAFTFRGEGNLQNGDIGQVRFNNGPGNSVVVAVDVDGDGRGDMHLLVQGVNSLNASDFIL